MNPKRNAGPWAKRPRPLAPVPRTPPAGRATRAELLEQLAEARAAGDRQRMGELYGRLMTTPRDSPPRSNA